MRNNRGCADSMIVSRSIVRNVGSTTSFTPLRGPTRLVNVRRTLGSFPRLGSGGITMFSATFRRAVPRRSCLCTLPCGLCGRRNVHHCNTRNADRFCMARRTTGVLGGPMRRLGVVAYRLNGNNSISTVHGNGYISASVNLAPLRNLIVNAHSNSVSPTVVFRLRSALNVDISTVGGLLAGRSNLLNLARIADSYHCIRSGCTAGRSTGHTVSICYRHLTGCVNTCATLVSNHLSTIMFANNVNRGTTVIHRLSLNGLNILNFRISRRHGLTTHFNGSNFVGGRNAHPTIIVPAGRRLIVTRSTDHLAT